MMNIAYEQEFYRSNDSTCFSRARARLQPKMSTGKTISTFWKNRIYSVSCRTMSDFYWQCLLSIDWLFDDCSNERSFAAAGTHKFHWRILDNRYVDDMHEPNMICCSISTTYRLIFVCSCWKTFETD
jgi:hypothetical protein